MSRKKYHFVRQKNEIFAIAVLEIGTRRENFRPFCIAHFVTSFSLFVLLFRAARAYICVSVWLEMIVCALCLFLVLRCPMMNMNLFRSVVSLSLVVFFGLVLFVSSHGCHAIHRAPMWSNKMKRGATVTWDVPRLVDLSRDVDCWA